MTELATQTETIAELAALLAAQPGRLAELVAPLEPAEAAALVDQLKSEADRHLWINAHRALELGALIVRVGQLRAHPGQQALGQMQRADALRALGQIGEAWDTFALAGELFQRDDNPVGWARTRIGRLLCSTEINTVPQALADAEAARAIFSTHGQLDRLLALTHSMAIVEHQVGAYGRALERYRQALAIAEQVDDYGRRNLGLLHCDAGSTYHTLGDFERALDHYRRALAICVARGETRGVALVEINMADIAISRDQYRQALQLLHQARDRYTAEQLALDAAITSRSIVECFLQLNRFAEARELALATIGTFADCGAAYHQALTSLLLASAEAALGNVAAADAALTRAEAIFGSLQAGAWLATTRLRRGQIALRRGELALAYELAGAALSDLAGSGRQLDYATAALLYGQASLADGHSAAARAYAKDALAVARGQGIASLRYSAHLLLGRAAEAEQRQPAALRHYRAALAAVERVERDLTITLRPAFLEDKGDALRRLIRLLLAQGQPRAALEAIERSKAQSLLRYLANREQLHWGAGEPHNQALLSELARLRAEHHWFYRIAYEQAEPGVAAGSLDPAQARAEVAARERQMRAITERLYLNRPAERQADVAPPQLEPIARGLPADCALVEYYCDGDEIWAFVVGGSEVVARRLPASAEQIGRQIEQLQSNIEFALKAGPSSPATRGLGQIAQRILGRCHAALVAPLADLLGQRRRLLIVPHGALHFLPFHLLHDGASYLIERHELVILPAASMLARPQLCRPRGARVLAHSWAGRLAQALAEGQQIQRRFGGQLAAEQDAQRSVLAGPPLQILHIAAHGQHRIDQPDLSYIELADGQLYTDDALQHDLSYELVVLSACETGRAHVAAGDELIGIGRGFLYAGAGALITSMWRVADDQSLAIVEQLYHNLDAGLPKAAALRQAQLAVRGTCASDHPAFWGVFQLVGNPEPLSRHGA